MPLSEAHPDVVVFVCDEAPNGSKWPVGTAFLVGLPAGPGLWWRYFVTAAHVVQDGRQRWIRLRRADGNVVHEPVGNWEFHPTSDVAATPCELDLSDTVHGLVEDWIFYDRWAERRVGGVPLRIGEAAYFIGLLPDVASMANRNIPMVRSGRIGAFNQVRIPMTSGNTKRTEPTAHLLDTYSRAGFSGSPCFADHPVIDPGDGGGLTVGSRVTLIGVVIGHFRSDAGDNEGVAVVTPVERIRELLNTERLLEWRGGEDKEIATRADGEGSPPIRAGRAAVERWRRRFRRGGEADGN